MSPSKCSCTHLCSSTGSIGTKNIMQQRVQIARVVNTADHVRSAYFTTFPPPTGKAEKRKQDLIIAIRELQSCAGTFGGLGVEAGKREVKKDSPEYFEHLYDQLLQDTKPMLYAFSLSLPIST